MRHALHRKRQDLQRINATKSERRRGHEQRGPRNHFRFRLHHHIALCFFDYHQPTSPGAAVQNERVQLWTLLPLINLGRKLLGPAGKQPATYMLLRRRRSIAAAALAIAAAALAIAAAAIAIAAAALALSAAASVTERDAAS